MGTLLDKPLTQKHIDKGDGNGLNYCVSSMQGWRPEMEDSHAVMIGLKGLKGWSFFAIFDGHAGIYVSQYCSENLLNVILETDEFKEIIALNDFKEEHIEKVKIGIREGFLAIDQKMLDSPDIASGEDKSGSTAVCAIITPTYIFFINCGDSRAVLCGSGKVVFSTRDHKPYDPIEKKRIQNAGGSVMIQRVNGSLAVSRALGDYEYKQCKNLSACEQLVSPEPEITVKLRDNDKDEFLALACDGIWDVMSNEDVCLYIRYQLQLGTSIEDIASSVLDVCLHKGSRDNMSIALILLPGAPKTDEQVQCNDKEINKVLENEIEELLKDDPKATVHDIVRKLEDVSFLNLPPGAGIDGKKQFIEEYFKEKTEKKVDIVDN